MKILVPVKRVVDAYVKIRLKSDHSDIDTQNVKMSMNPFDEIALEEALRLKEQGPATEIVAVSIGSLTSQETLRQALALGADRAILIQTDLSLESLAIAKLLKVLCDREAPELLILGKQAIDNDANQTGQMLAALLNWPQATFASKVSIDQQQVTIEREIDGGLQTLRFTLPGLITTDLRLNTPRFAKLPNIMKAKSKPLEIIPAETLNVDLTTRLTTLSVTAPAARQKGIFVTTVDELLDKLRHEAKVIV